MLTKNEMLGLLWVLPLVAVCDTVANVVEWVFR